MKSILVLALLSVVFGVGEAYGYEGEIVITDEKLNDLIIGDEFSIEGYYNEAPHILTGI